MLSEVDATAIARSHVNALDPPPAGFAWRHTDGRRVPGGWYFDYGYDVLPGHPPDDGLCGAPGFLVSDDGQVTVVGIWDLRSVFETGRPGRR